MNYLIRFHLYENPSRQNFRQLGSDQWVQKPPRFIYGLPYRLEAKEFGQIGYPCQVYVGSQASDSSTALRNWAE